MTPSTPALSIDPIMSSAIQFMIGGTWWIASFLRAPMCEWASMTSIFSPSTVIIVPPKTFSERIQSMIAGQHEVQYRRRMTLILSNEDIQRALTIKDSLDALEETYREL